MPRELDQMGGRRRVKTLRGLTTTVSVAALLLAGPLLAASAFHLAWFGRVQSGMAESPAETAAKRQALDAIRANLGHGGLLQSMALTAETGSEEARQETTAALDEASRALRGYQAQRLTPTEADLARDLERMLGTYRRVLGEDSLSGKAALILMTQHAAVADRIGALKYEQAAAEQARLEQIATRGFWLGTATVAVLGVVLGLLAWLVRVRILAPLTVLRESLDGVARGDWRAPVWGADREDEIGDMARAVDAFRREAAEIPDVSLVSETGRIRLKFEGEAQDLFTALTDRLRQSGAALSLNGEQVAKLVQEVRSDLTGTATQLREICADVGRTAADSNEKLGAAATHLTHAAQQVEALNPEGPGGGLDGLIATLRDHAARLEETLTVAGRSVDYSLRSIAGNEGAMRQATATARDAARDLAAELTDAQDKLLMAVKLLKASGELLGHTVTDAGAKLDRAVEKVDAGEQALVAALGQATTQLDAATQAATGRLDSAAEQVLRSADLLDQQASGVGGRLHGAVDELNEASAILRATTETQTEKLDPLAGDLLRLQDGLSAIAADVGLRAGEIGGALEQFRGLFDEVGAKLDRLRVEPDQRRLAGEMVMRLQEATQALAGQVEAVEDAAQRMTHTLGGSMAEATDRLRDATADLQQEGRALAAETATATGALTRTAARQDQILDSLQETAAQTAVVAELQQSMAELKDIADGLSAATAAVQALATVADLREDSQHDLAEIGRELRARMDGLEGLAGGLTAASEAVRALMTVTENQRGGDEMARLAEELRMRLSGMERLGSELASATQAVRALEGRDRGTLSAFADLAQAMHARMGGLDTVNAELVRAVETLRTVSDRQSISQANAGAATRELGQRLADIAEQLRATASGVQDAMGVRV